MRRRFFLFISVIILTSACNKPSDPVLSDEGRILVLMYHRLVEGTPSNLYERSVASFEADLKYFRDHDIKVISLNDLEIIASLGKMPGGNCVVITFDDGDHSWFTLARPLLLQYKVRATFYLWTDMMGHDSFLTWDEVDLMSHYMYSDGEKPFVFGSHTFSHQFLLQRKTGFSTDAEYNSFLDYELGVSKKVIEDHSGVTVTALSLPFGDGEGDEQIITAVKRNGYKFIRTSHWGAIEKAPINLFTIPGFPMLDTTSSAVVKSYLNL